MCHPGWKGDGEEEEGGASLEENQEGFFFLSVGKVSRVNEILA